MTLKYLQEEGEKEFREKWLKYQFSLNGNDAYDGQDEDKILLFINQRTSIAYELGKKETLDMVLKEIEETIQAERFSGAPKALSILKQKLLQANPREEI